MIIKKIKLINIRSFKKAEVKFGKSNVISGRNLDTDDSNGLGKTSLIQSLFILLFGAKIVDINLNKFIRSKEDKAEIEGIIEVNEDILEMKRILKRNGSSTLSLKINNEDPQCKTSKDYQDLVIKYLGEPETFKKFRLIDPNSGINVLDFTPTKLRQTLMGICQDRFDGLRKKLLDKKSHFEKYNKDAVIFKHAPSDKRLKILTSAIESFETSKLEEIKNKLREFQNDKMSSLKDQGECSKSIQIKKAQAYKLNSINTCPTCFQSVSSEYKKEILDELNNEINKFDKKLKEIQKQDKIYSDIIKSEEKRKDNIQKQKEKLNTLKYKLESRLKQKEYKYSDKDIELVKEAISVIDNFASYYVKEWVNVIEPIVNSYIRKLNMRFSFEVNEKGNISIIIKRDSEVFEYDQLSNGEKIFVSIIFKIALLMESNEQGLMISDEGTDALSTENIQRILSIIQQLPIQFIFVTHNPEVDFGTDAQKIYIEKENGVSTIK